MKHQTVGDGDGDAVELHALCVDDFEPLGWKATSFEAQVEGPLGGGRRQGRATFGHQ